MEANGKEITSKILAECRTAQKMPFCAWPSSFVSTRSALLTFLHFEQIDNSGSVLLLFSPRLRCYPISPSKELTLLKGGLKASQ
jgi:hypothetical protein